MSRLRKNGFSLIEVLVSLLVLGLGVIGAAGMQVAALRTAQQSAFQTVALHLAGEIADAIHAASRLNRTADVISLFEIDYRSASDGDPPAPAKLCYANDCDAAELAEFNIYEWKKRVKAALPGGRVLVCRDSSPWNDARKTLVWDCAGGSQSHAPLVVKLGWQMKNPDGSLLRDSNNAFPPSVALTVAL